MGRIYTAQFNAVAITAQQDLFELVMPATCIGVIHAIEIEQTSEVGDTQEEGLALLFKSGQTTSGSGGSAPAKVAAQVSDAASGATVEANNTTKASVGTIITHFAWSWNVRLPFNKLFTPEMRPVIAPSRRCTLELATTPADSITCNGTITWEEIG